MLIFQKHVSLNKKSAMELKSQHYYEVISQINLILLYLV